jgi:hypothetical protein
VIKDNTVNDYLIKKNFGHGYSFELGSFFLLTLVPFCVREERKPIKNGEKRALEIN